jgi:alpha-tubulin suppressor-like RCC1 family protein
MDSAGRPVEGQAVRFGVVTGGGSVLAGAAQTDGVGLAKERWTLGTAASDTQTVQAGVVDNKSGALVLPVTFRAIGLPDRPAVITKLAGDLQEGAAGSLLAESLTVRVMDPHGNSATGATVGWSVIAGGGRVSPEASVTDANGHASTAWTLGTASGSQRAKAELLGPTSTEFAATSEAGPPTALMKIIGDQQSGALGATLADSLAVKVTDQYGNGVPGAPVVWSIVAGGGTVSPSTPPTDGTGIAKTAWTLGTRIDTPHVAEASVANAPPENFTATPTLPSDATVGMGGGSQTGTVKLPLAESLSVVVALSDGRPVLGASVNWMAAAGEGVVTPTTGRTDGAGRLASRWTLGPVTGNQTVQVAVESRPAISLVATAWTGGGLTMLTSGATHSCGLTAGGTAFCWGQNVYGGVGDGTTTDRLTPAAVAGGLSFTALTSGGWYTCGLTADGTAYCWGRNSSGQLGDGSTTDRLTPVAVAGGLSFTALAAGDRHTCALTSGGAYCWGSDDFGQLGDSATFSRRETPVLVVGGLSFVALAAGDRHTCGLTPGGAAYCWGSGYNGQLGNGVTIDRQDTPVAVAGDLSFTTLVAGHFYTCGLTGDGAAYCWGQSGYGQLGNGSTCPADPPGNELCYQTTPGAVEGGLSFSALTSDNGTTSPTHTCGLTAGGAAYCWGPNGYGQLGDGSICPFESGRDQLCYSTTPVLVAGGLSFAALASGGHHACGLTQGGTTYCWGANFFGQVGDGSTAHQLTPVAVKYITPP